jgi:hypothetical protein
MRTALGSATSFLGKVLWYVRQVSGDAAYENYLRCKARRAAVSAEAGLGDELVSEKEFYLENIRRQYSRISRCC